MLDVIFMGRRVLGCAFQHVVWFCGENTLPIPNRVGELCYHKQLHKCKTSVGNIRVRLYGPTVQNPDLISPQTAVLTCNS